MPLTVETSDHKSTDGKYSHQVFYVVPKAKNKFVKAFVCIYSSKAICWSNHYEIRVRRDFHHYS